MDIKIELLKLGLLFIAAVLVIKLVDFLPKIIRKPDDKNRENLVLVHSFPTNSILLAGLVDYLDDYFNVYFIDLPGFTRGVPALSDISMDAYARYVEKEIDRLKLESYSLGGISFGFAVVNKVNVDPSKCKAILAIEPYVSREYLNIGFIKSFLYANLLEVFSSNRELADSLWKNGLADETLSFLTGQPTSSTQTMLKEIDGHTFFETAKILMKSRSEIVFQKNVPYVLFINENDDTVDADKITSLFRRNIEPENLKIVNTDIEHYPTDISKEYFQKHLKPYELFEVFDWINQKKLQP